MLADVDLQQTAHSLLQPPDSTALELEQQMLDRLHADRVLQSRKL